MAVSKYNLKKVTLSIKTDRQLESVPFEFIYGVGSEGLCPFEVMLADKVEGDTLQVEIAGVRAAETFAHLFVPLRFALDLREVPVSFCLDLKVAGVAETENREVVQAIAKATHFTGCGGSCSCGCGE